MAVFFFNESESKVSCLWFIFFFSLYGVFMRCFIVLVVVLIILKTNQFPLLFSLSAEKTLIPMVDMELLSMFWLMVNLKFVCFKLLNMIRINIYSLFTGDLFYPFIGLILHILDFHLSFRESLELWSLIC